MNEPIVVARVRRPMKLDVKPGDWIIVSSPDETFSESNKQFETLLAPVNEKYSRIIIGKIQHSRNAQNPITEEQQKAKTASITEQSQKVLEVVATSQKREDANQQKKANDMAAQQKIELEKKNAAIEKLRKQTNYYKDNP